jgi:putative hydrolase of the HAD superfamily
MHHIFMENMDLSIDQYAERQSKRRLRRRTGTIISARIAANLPKIKDAAAVLWDVYGTLLTLTIGDLESTLAKKDAMLEAFGRTIREFSLGRFLDGTPSEALLNLYVGEIEKTHRRKKSRGVFSPEVRIEHIWLRILKRLEARGYRPDGGQGVVDIALAQKVAYFFDDVHQAKALYPNALETLTAVREMGLRQGIISNAQFYTPIMLNILLRRAGHRGPNPLANLFGRQLTFYSYRLGVSKPNPLAFERAKKRLCAKGIEPARVIYVGNDVLNDMLPAHDVGFKAVLFAGDSESLNLRKDRPDCAGFKPDATIKKLPQLLEIIS